MKFKAAFAVKERAYKFDESLIPISTDITLGVDDLAEGFAELNKLLFGALPWKVAKVKNLRRRLSVPELLLPSCRHP